MKKILSTFLVSVSCYSLASQNLLSKEFDNKFEYFKRFSQGSSIEPRLTLPKQVNESYLAFSPWGNRPSSGQKTLNENSKNYELDKQRIQDFFEDSFYLEKYKEILKKTELSPLDHFMRVGWRMGCAPASFFNPGLYQFSFPCNGNPFLNWLSQPSGINTAEKRERELIVSLTSYPARDHASWLAIESIMRQTLKPDRIILWLYEGQYPDGKIPQALEILKKRGLEVRFCKTDFKSATKLIPAIAEFPDALIVTVDDDNVMSDHFLEDLYQAHLKEPEVIFAHLGREIRKDNEGYLEIFTQWPRITAPLYESDRLTQMGAWGVLYPPNSLDQEVFNQKSLFDIALAQDDLWFWAMAKLKGTRIKTCKFQNFRTIQGTAAQGLWATVNSKGGNDVAIQKLRERYSLDIAPSRLNLRDFPFEVLKPWLGGYQDFEKTLDLSLDLKNLKNVLKIDGLNGRATNDAMEIVPFADHFGFFQPVYTYLIANNRPNLLVPFSNSMKLFSKLSQTSDFSKGPLIPLKAHRVWITSSHTPSEVLPKMLENYFLSFQKTSKLEQNFWCLDPKKIPQTIAFLKDKMPGLKIRNVEELFQASNFRGKAYYDAFLEKGYYTLASDIVRLNILYQEGGIYNNLGDLLPFDISPLLTAYDFLTYCRTGGRAFDTNFTACPPNSKVLNLLWDRLENWSAEDDGKTVSRYGAGFIGGHLLTDIIYQEWFNGLNVFVIPDRGGPYQNYSMKSWYGTGGKGNTPLKRSLFLELNLGQKLKRLSATVHDAIQENQSYNFITARPLSMKTSQNGYGDAVLLMAFKDEEDILFENLCWHYSIGIRKFFLMDNLSTDSSAQKVEEFQKLTQKDAIVLVLKDSIVEHIQRNKMTGAIKMAQEIFPTAKWALPTDADEFWCPVASLEDIFSRVPDGIDAIFTQHFYYQTVKNKDLESGKPFYQTLTFKTTINPQVNPLVPPQGIPFSVLEEQWKGKSILRLPFKERTCNGNHFMISEYESKEPIGNYISGNAIGIHMREYPVRSFEQFEEKVKNKGIARGKAIELGVRQKSGHYTERNYEIYQKFGEEGLKKEFQKIMTCNGIGCEDPLPLDEITKGVLDKLL